VSALLTSKFPIYEIKDEQVVDTGKIMPPPITTMPISITAVRIGESVLLDPTTEEEACMDARITMTTQSDGNIVAVQKGFTGPFSINQIVQFSEIARIKGEEMRSKIKELN
jgi:exosome complex component RRP42